MNYSLEMMFQNYNISEIELIDKKTQLNNVIHQEF